MSNGTPQRRSIFSGLLLIVFGTLLLLGNLRPEMHVWRWLADYWPVLLIVWGLAKLYDYFAARSAGMPPPRTLTGGEVFLLILLILVGSAMTGARYFVRDNPEVWDVLPPELTGHEHSFTEEVVRPAKANAAISIRNEVGNVTVQAADVSDIRVVAKKTARAWELEDATELARKVQVVIEEGPDGFEILPRGTGGHPKKVRVDLEVHVPRQATLRTETQRGDVTISDAQGAVSVTSGGGDLDLRQAGGDVVVEMRRGDVRVSGAKGKVRITGRGSEVDVGDVAAEALIQGEFYGPIRVKNVAREVHFLSQRTDLTISQLPGRMEMSSGRLEVYDTPGSVTLRAKDKDVLLENVGGRLRIENRRGDVQVRLRQPPKQEIEIGNESGSVELEMPGESSFELVATSQKGEVDNEFESPELKVRRDDKGGSVEGSVGTRGPKIQMRTTYGSIHLRKND